MLRSVNVLFVVALVVLLVIAFDPQARVEAKTFWQELRSVMDQLQVQVSHVIDQITRHGSSDLPAEGQESLPPYDGPVFNTNLNESWDSLNNF